MYYNNPLVLTTENMVKEGINYMETKRNVVETAITRHKEKIKWTQSKNLEKVFKVLSFVIYTIIGNYICIDYSPSES